MGQSWVRHARSRLFVPESVGGGGGFNPADYGADYSWWAGRLESFTNGQNVTTWTDRGSGTLTVSAGAGQEPTFHTSADPVSPNGQSFLRWANGDRLLNLTTGITGPWTAAVVCRPTALLTSRVPLIGGSPTLGTSGLKLSAGSSGSMLLYCGNVIALVFAPSSPVGGGYQPISPLGWQVVVGTFHNGNSNQGMALMKSGLTVGASPNNFLSDSGGAGTGQNVAAGVFCVGGNTYVGEIAEAVVWRQTMNAATRILIGKTLADLYGVTY